MNFNKKLTNLLLLVFIFMNSCMDRTPLNSSISDWELVFEDNFDSYDSNKWIKSNHTFDGNASFFSPGNIQFENGILKLNLTNESFSSKTYTGAEISTIDSFLYGKFVINMKVPSGSGIISSFFQMFLNPRQELDVEILGKNTSIMQRSVHYSIEGNQNYISDTFDIDLGFDASKDFHEYSIIWEENKISWFVDSILVSEFNEYIPNQSMNVIMNIWLSESISWAGEIDENSLPTKVYYDYVKIYRKN